jgi:hypothetical protein
MQWYSLWILLSSVEASLATRLVKRVKHSTPVLASQTIQFAACHQVNTTNKNNETTIASTVQFRLCTSSSCTLCNANTTSKPFMVPLETYLDSTVAYFRRRQESTCLACAETCVQDTTEGVVGESLDVTAELDCDTCMDECEKIAHMEENGYIDATVFSTCTMIYDPPEEEGTPLYAAPICASQGSKINIGVFVDKECRILDASKNVDDYLVSSDGMQMKLSHALLKQSYRDTCISCAAEGDTVADVCKELNKALLHCKAQQPPGNGTQSKPYVGSKKESLCDLIQTGASTP